jgi:hypothetical protein
MKLFDRSVKPIRDNLYCNLCGEPGEFASAIFWCKDCKMYVHIGDVVEAKVVREVGQGFSTSDTPSTIFRTLECGHVMDRQQTNGA